MAVCYHDKHDFKSELNIEVAREGDILEAGQDLKDIKCDKNPGHRDFIPFKDLTLRHLPNEIRNREMLEMIRIKGRTVVRLKVLIDKMEYGKRINVIKYGSGSVKKIDNEFFIRTNNHVVKTDDEVKHCTVEFHYDSTDRSSVLTSTGVKLIVTCPNRDITFFTFNPVHEFLHEPESMDDRLPQIVIMYKNINIETLEVLIGSKLFERCFFSSVDLNSPQILMMFISIPSGSFSYFKSAYFKFQPIPSNIQQLTSIEIHKDQDDGIRRVIPGNVVKFGDEFVVKISGTIFQDEVKKCRLVWNSKVIGRGTRLYFQQVKTSDIYSGIDLEQCMERGIDNLWIYDFHPIPSGIKRNLDSQDASDNLCCIGHPHAGIKMVTFGRALGVSLEKFDNLYRRITQPGPDCRCKEVGCLSYSCKTCPGSSGCPVLDLFAGLSYSHSHFLGESVKAYRIRGELIENKNIAWCPVSANKN